MSKKTLLRMPQTHNNNCIVFVANLGRELKNSRTEYLQHFLDAGWQVVIVTDDSPYSEALVKLGVTHIKNEFYRGGISPLKDILSLFRLWRTYQKFRPKIVQHFHLKPVIFGSLAVKLLPFSSIQVINTVTGLGYAYSSSPKLAQRLGTGFRMTLPNTLTIFQNPDDKQLFEKNQWVDATKSRLIVSSGVRIDDFPFRERKDRDPQKPIVVMVTRLLKQKGINEFIRVAHETHKALPNARFLIAGDPDEHHPDAISADWLKQQTEIEYLGKVTDVNALLAKADVFLFPSYYKEGVPRAILEASATGLPVVAYDVPGVREAIENNETGFLVPVHDFSLLNEKVQALLTNKKLRSQVGIAGHELMKKRFDKKLIDEQYMQIYRSVTEKLAS